jgi:hypothetical protein
MILTAKECDVRRIVNMAQSIRSCSEFSLTDVETCVKSYTSFISSGIGVMLYIEDNGEVIGAIAGLKAPDIHFPRVIAIETFWYVTPEHSGIGLRLWKAFEDWGKGNGCSHIAMIHLADSYPESLEKWYIRRGYKLMEKHYIKAVN